MSNAALNTSPCTHGFIQASCTSCNLKGICLPLAMDINDIDRLDSIIQRSRPIQGGEHLYRAGDKFTSIFAVRSGSIKTYMIDDDGIEQITGFYLPGEVLGFDGIDNESYGCNVIALDTSTVCEIPFARMEELSLQVPSLQRHFHQLMSRQIELNHRLLLTISKKNAEGRVATLLLSLSQRNSRRKLSPTAMRLPMSRMDIGNFLGLTIETVSRTFSRLQKENIISVDGREVIINDHEKLSELSHKTR